MGKRLQRDRTLTENAFSHHLALYLPLGLQFVKAAEAELVQDVIATPKAFLNESLASEA